MRIAISVFAISLNIFASRVAFSDVLPVVSTNHFTVSEILPNSKALVVSDSRSFYCDVAQNEESGYLLLEKCLPFVFSEEANTRENELAPARASAAKKDKDALNIAIIERNDNKLNWAKPEAVQNVLISAARKSNCVLTISSLSMKNLKFASEVVDGIGLASATLTSEQSEKLRSLVVSATAALIETGAMESSDSGASIKLKDCH